MAFDLAPGFIVKNKEPELIFSQNYPNSIGLVYSAITEYLGFRLNDGEFKVMVPIGTRTCTVGFFCLIQEHFRVT